MSGGTPLAPPATPERCHALGVAWLRSRGWTPTLERAGIVVRLRDGNGAEHPIGEARAIQRARDEVAQRRAIGCPCPAGAGHVVIGCKFRRSTYGAIGPRPGRGPKGAA